VRRREMNVTIENKQETDVTVTAYEITQKQPLSIPPGQKRTMQTSDCFDITLYYDEKGLERSITKSHCTTGQLVLYRVGGNGDLMLGLG
jgi:hypothetical protein